MPRNRESSAAAEAAQPRELPRWMRLYFYGMHGLTLDVLLSSARGVASDGDPRLVGFSSPYLCFLHSLAHLALEEMYARRARFRVGPATFHLVLYPCVYIGLQILIGSVAPAEPVTRSTCVTQLAAHYVLALYFTLVFHRLVSRLRYHPCCAGDPLRAPARGAGHPRSLPGSVRFLFFSMHGLVDEVLFTSVFNLVENRSLGGYTSLWSFLMYGSCSFVVERLYYHLHFGRGWGTRRRLPIYVCFIYAWELSWGLALRRFDACSWDYSHYPHNFMGLITLLYLPGWVCLSLYQDVLSNVLLQVKCAGEGAEVRGEDGEDGEVLRGRLEAKEKLL